MQIHKKKPPIIKIRILTVDGICDLLDYSAESMGLNTL